MKNIDLNRAFPQTPDCISAAIELGIRKGKHKMKFRNKIITMGSVAAVFAVVIAAALAMGIQRPETPDVLARPPMNASALAGPKAPGVLARPEQAPFTVYTTESGNYYHLDAHCSGMENASAMTEAEAMRLSKQPCPVCIPLSCSGHDREEIEFVYYSQGGVYFHKTEECSGGTFVLKDEYLTLIEEFPEKQPCPVCFPYGIDICLHGKAFVLENKEPESAAVPEEPALIQQPEAEEYTPQASESDMTHHEKSTMNTPAVYAVYGASGKYYHKARTCGDQENRREITLEQAKHENLTACPYCYGDSVYYTANGTYYHSDEHCQGMMNAKTHTRVDTRKNRKSPCPICLMVYCTESGRYYHLLPDCIGMEGAKLRTLDEACALNKTRCPVCLSPETVYATRKGNYFHVFSACSGMVDAQPTDPETAWLAGKAACPVCLPQLSESSALVPDADPKQYITDAGLYYHTQDTCSGVSGMQSIPPEALDELNKIACPVCSLGLETVYATPTGNYYHSLPDCSGMEGAQAMTAAHAYTRLSAGGYVYGNHVPGARCSFYRCE